MTKYPGADISPERLAEIEEMYPRIYTSSGQGTAIVRDLLAMLHDTRWRKLSDEEPGLAVVVTVKINDPDPEDLPYQTIVFGADDVEFDWWCPVLPVPKE